MKKGSKPSLLIIGIIVAFGALGVSIFMIDWIDKNLTNPRIWKNMTCEEMKEFALGNGDEKLNDFQRIKFHEDLTLCMGN